MKPLLWVAGAFVVAFAVSAATPAGNAFHGSWWRARDLAGTSAVMGLDHAGHETSTATNLVTGEVFRADVSWSGQQFAGLLFDGTATVKLFDAAGNLVHQNTFPALEDISNVDWIQCPAGSGDPDNDLETLPTYSLVAPLILNLGPGAAGGTGIMRNSFCGNFNDPNTPTYFKGFSDYTGTYLTGPLGDEFGLHLHVRGADHG